jgi:hypothetical protein
LPVVALDGRTTAALAQDGKPVLFSIDGGEARPCPGLEPADRPIGWSADGRLLFFARYHGLTTEVHRLELATGQRKLLWELAARDAAVAGPRGTGPTTAGVRLTSDGKSYAYSLVRSLFDLYLVDGLR